jgi:hypothetical protein
MPELVPAIYMGMTVDVQVRSEGVRATSRVLEPEARPRTARRTIAK